MNILKQLKENYRKGYFSVVERDDGYKKLFALKYKDGFYCSHWCETIEQCKEYFNYTFSFNDTKKYSKKDNWKIIDTIYPSQFEEEKEMTTSFSRDPLLLDLEKRIKVLEKKIK